MNHKLLRCRHKGIVEAIEEGVFSFEEFHRASKNLAEVALKLDVYYVEDKVDGRSAGFEYDEGGSADKDGVVINQLCDNTCQ